MIRTKLLGSLVVAFAAVTGVALADVVVIEPVRDNTLYEDATGALSNGVGEYLFAGRTGTFDEEKLRRALLAFDIAANVPSGSTINSVSLTLNLSKVPPGSTPQTHALHRVLADWGEGTSNAGTPGGAGAASTTGDATWLHTFFNTNMWAAPGGDFNPTASASTAVNAIGPYVWSSSQMVADVQAWVDTPGDNFGWIVLGDESAIKEARRYDAREHLTSSNRPQLEIDYSAAPVPTVSQWGLVVLVLSILAAGTILLARPRAHQPAN